MFTPIIAVICCLSVFKPVSTAAQPRPNPSEYTVTDPGAVKQKLRAILARPEFAERPQHESDISKALQDYATSIETTWLDFTRWLQKWYERLKELFSFGGGGIGSTNVVFVCLFIGACLVTGLYLLIKYISRIGGLRLRPNGRMSSSSTLHEDEIDDALTQMPEEWLSEANRLVDQQDFRAAMRARFLAVLLQLDASGRLEYTRTQTNGDHLIRLTLNSSPNISLAFRRLARDFDFYWYGEHKADRSDYERSTKDCELVAESIVTTRHQTTGKEDAIGSEFG